MADAMQFPESWKQFLHDYEFRDSSMEYTNGSMLVPSFRVEQMIEHYFRDAVPVVRCRECEHAKQYERADGTAGYYCGHPQNTFVFGDRWDRVFKPVKKPDDFCSYGQRKNQSADVRNMGQFAGGGNMDGGGADAP